MNLTKTYTLESKSLPGVVFTLQRIGPRKRSQIELDLAKVRARQRELRMRMAALSERLDKMLMQDADVRAKMEQLSKPRDAETESASLDSSALTFGELAKADLPEDVLKLVNELQETVETLIAVNTCQIQPAFISAAVVAINDQLTYDGQPATPELLCEYGPSDLFDEVARAVNEGVYVPQKDAENLSLPTTSGALMAGQNSTAQSVSNADSTGNATATGDTPKA